MSNACIMLMMIFVIGTASAEIKRRIHLKLFQRFVAHAAAHLKFFLPQANLK